jgi:D-beta-D-heptose 7-phosphate kinase/D-beta-D-heptose 1-phosphate adenosyltransferase
MPNRPELGGATGMPVGTQEEIVAAAQHLRATLGFGAVVVTLGNDGMTLIDANGSIHFPAEAADVYDTSGAGDTALATLGAGLAAKLDLPVAVRLANLAAGISVGKVGVSVVREADILSALTPQRSALRKIVTPEEAVEQAERWRHRGWRVGVTHGVFDLLHQGHIHLIEQARASCDRLIIGLHSDASARRLRGARLPVQPEAARAAVLASFACVDLVCLIEDDTAEALIESLRPDALINGGKHPVEEAAGVDLMREWGGKVIMVKPSRVGA